MYVNLLHVQLKERQKATDFSWFLTKSNYLFDNQSKSKAKAQNSIFMRVEPRRRQGTNLSFLSIVS